MRPNVTVNCAASIDGKISTPARKRVKISSDEDLSRVMMLRRDYDAIAVGIGTVLSDDPVLLPAAESRQIQLPARVVFDSNCRIPDEARILSGGGRVFIVTSEWNTRRLPGCEMIRCGEGKTDILKALDRLYERGIRRMLLEGGGRLIFEFMRVRAVDRLLVYTAPVIIGGAASPTLADGEGFLSEEEFARFRLMGFGREGEGLLCEYERRD